MISRGRPRPRLWAAAIEVVAEQGFLSAHQGEVMADVGGGLLKAKGLELIADPDALVEGL